MPHRASDSSQALPGELPLLTNRQPSAIEVLRCDREPGALDRRDPSRLAPSGMGALALEAGPGPETDLEIIGVCMPTSMDGHMRSRLFP